VWTRVLRDRDLVATIAPNLQPFSDYVAPAAKVVSTGWGSRGRRKRMLDAAVRHAVDFGTWQSLVRSG